MTMASFQRPAAPVAGPRLWPVFAAYAIVFGAMIVAGVAIVVATAVGRGALPSERELEAIVMAPGALVVSAAASCVALAAVSLLAARLSPIPLRERLRLRPAEGGLGRGVVMVVLATMGGLALGQAFESATALSGVEVSSTLGLLAKATRTMPTSSFVLLLLVGSVGAGIGEELFFRGYMQTRLVRRWGRWRGIVVTAAAFGLLHADVLHAPAALLIGIYLGWLAELRGSIRLPIVVHVLNNFVSFSLMRLTPDEPFSTQLNGALIAISAVVLAGAVVVLKRLFRERLEHAEERGRQKLQVTTPPPPSGPA